MESIAVYWEPVVRVYGFEHLSDVSLLKIDYPLSKAHALADSLINPGCEGTSFLFSQIQLASPNSAAMSIALNKSHLDELLPHLKRAEEEELSLSVTVHQPVDLLFFHGPHFQDRYGIAETAFSALDLTRVTIHSIGCTGTSIYIIADGGQGLLVKKMLSDAFTVPREHTKINKE